MLTRIGTALTIAAAALTAPVWAANHGLAALAPLPASPPVDRAIAELGRHLFFDNRLSADGSRSCASCHDPAHGWSDGRTLGRGYMGAEYFRNVPGLANVWLRSRLTWDGRLDGADLPTAVRDMVTEAHTMQADSRLVQERLKQIPAYGEMWRAAFGQRAEPYGPRAFVAVAEFLKTLRSRNAPIDRYLRGERSALSREQRMGLALFTGKAGCMRCHHGSLASDGAFHRLGVPENPAVTAEPLRHITMLRHFATSGMPAYMNARADVGLYAITKDENDRGRFLTPSLRDLKYTAPYMHNGVFATLAQTVDFHDRGGGTGSEMKPLGLTAVEKKRLVAFLLALSGEPPRIVAPVQPDYALLPPPAPQAQAGSPEPAPGLPAIARAPRPLATLPPVPVPADNPVTGDKVALGRLLFFDPRLSGDGTTACAGCHFPQLGWGEASPVSRGYPGTRHWRNTQTVFNSAYYDKLFWDGSVTSLEAQAAAAAEGAVAGNGDPAMMEMRLRFVPEYVERFRKVFGTAWPRIHDAWRAIAAFERTLVSDPAQVPFDRSLKGVPNALRESQARGLTLFNGKAGCIRCHDGPLASDGRFHATGVPENRLVRGVAQIQITHRWQQYQRGVPERVYREGAHDRGLYYVSLEPKDIGKFRTPSLRELKHSAPYMHNGVFAMLEQVIEFYDRGGGDSPNKSALLQPLRLGDQEKRDLVAFLEALSMDRLPHYDPPVLPPYAPLPPQQPAPGR